MQTYKQDIKEKTRELLWNHAVRSLTQGRINSRVLNPDYLDNLWTFVKKAFDDNSSDLDDIKYEDWKRYGETTYGVKRPEDLKVAFFCGPEPENDVNHLVRLGVRIENMYAFEYDKDCFKAAVGSLHDSFPNLKIFRGNILDFLGLNEIKFDIIYLDFTRSLLTEFKAVFTILDSNVLADLGILMINTTFPDKTSDAVDFLTRYFLHSSCFEYCVFNGYDKEHYEDEVDGRFIESCSAYNYDYEDVKQLVEANFECAYSVFQTRIIMQYANLIKPEVAALNNRILQERIFAADADINGMLDDQDREKDFLFTRLVEGRPPISYMVEQMGVSNKVWKHFFEEEPNKNHSRIRCMKTAERFVVAKYENNEDVLSDALKGQLDEVDKNMIGKMGMFCDVPMVHLWLEMMLYQFGHSYHQNTSRHKRFCYTAKARKMCVDAFTFDKCRMFYDSLPLVEYLGSDTADVTRQMITRMAVDAIDKHSIWILEELYYGSALIGVNEEKWSKNHDLPNRIEIE